MTLPEYTQRLLVLLFGTFRTIASNAERANTGMTSEAIGVSVAPSFFQSCVSDGKTARMEDVLRFKVSDSSELFQSTVACPHCFQRGHSLFSALPIFRFRCLYY